MSLPEKIKQFLATNPLDEDGEPYESRLLPGMTLAEIEDLEQRLGFALPGSTKELLLFAKGIEEGPMEIIDFAGEVIDYLSSIPKKSIYRFLRMVLGIFGFTILIRVVMIWDQYIIINMKDQ